MKHVVGLGEDLEIIGNVYIIQTCLLHVQEIPFLPGTGDIIKVKQAGGE